MFRLGVDGGGSRCRVRLCGETGEVLAEIEGGPANVSLDFAGATATIRATIAACFQRAGLEPSAMPLTRAGLGLAGASSRAVAARVEAELDDFERVVVDHDGVAACLGAHAGQDGGIVIAGTGSVALLRRGGSTLSIGGRGFLLGDDGSGAWIGREIWRRALRVLDGLDPSTPFAEALLDTHGRDPVSVIAWARNALSRDFAAYAPQTFEAASRGDAMAQSVIRSAAAAIDELILALMRHACPRIALVGGMAPALEPYLPRTSTALLSPALADALAGALLLIDSRLQSADDR